MMYLKPNGLLQGGKYKIVRFLSNGGFGNTYEGVHTMMDTRVAIKEFFPKMFCNRDENTSHVTVATQGNRELVEKLRKKFNEEAKAVFQMNHPNIVRVLDIFDENGTAYYVMEYIDGKSLNEITKERGALSEAEAVGYIRQVADALKYVHSLNRLHLDIKPGNIMVDKNGKAILIDFGASKHYDDESGENTSTLMGVNTKGYAPIEQSTQSFTSFSPATDIYALGATLYKLLTGIVPPDANMILAEEEVLQPLPSNITATTRNAVMAAMQMKRKDRPQNVKTFMNRLAVPTNSNDRKTISIIEETILDSPQKNKYDELLAIAVHGDILAQRSLGDVLATGVGSDYNREKAIYWYTQAAEQGDPISQFELGRLYEEEDSVKSEYWFKKAVTNLSRNKKNDSNGRVNYSLACCFYYGWGTEDDEDKSQPLFDKAINLLEESAHKGDPISQHLLGEYYDVIEDDREKTIYWYRKAAEQGHIEASFFLGCKFYEDKEQSIYWFSKAAEQGHTDAQYELDDLQGKHDFVKEEYVQTLYNLFLHEILTSQEDVKKYLVKANGDLLTAGQAMNERCLKVRGYYIKDLEKKLLFPEEKKTNVSTNDKEVKQKKVGCLGHLWRIFVTVILMSVAALILGLIVPIAPVAGIGGTIIGFWVAGKIFGKD